MNAIKEHLGPWLKDIAVSVIIALSVFGVLFAYSGVWPPMVVVESGSMSHSEDSQIGVIDAGDLVVVKGGARITTYVEGRATGYRAYGDYGDVIIYSNGARDGEWIIHRALIYLKYNDTGGGWDAPSLKNLEYGTAKDWLVLGTYNPLKPYLNMRGTLVIYRVGYNERTVKIDLDALQPVSGYITFGDHNVATDPALYDQNTNICPRHPVPAEWVIGKAEGEVPWLGALKLYAMGRGSEVPGNSGIMAFLIVFAVIVLPWVYDEVRERTRPPREEGEGGGAEDEEESDMNAESSSSESPVAEEISDSE